MRSILREHDVVAVGDVVFLVDGSTTNRVIIEDGKGWALVGTGCP